MGANCADMRLADYIGTIGDRRFAELIGVSRRVVTDWRVGKRTPRPATAQKIVAKSKGRVSMADVYGADGSRKT